MKAVDEEIVEVVDGMTIESLYNHLFSPAPPAGRIPVMFARNQSYVTPDTRLCAGDEVAFIPPLGGG